ncbi:tautomerase family protein [Nocardioides sp. GCM10030258]|uniref:tautomerase family protein n=1 Tax=unclassified Nocardioides TaxID=2615069 RepID=UPI00360DE9C6
MPLWNIQTPIGAYTADQKKAFAKDITAAYTETVGIPAFYVVVNFREVPEEDFLVGGEPVGNFIRIFVDHVARQLETAELRAWASEEFEKALVPHVKDRGFDWEWHVDETPMDLWRTQGLVPPPAFSDVEKLWAKENRPIPYEVAAS